MKPRFTSIINRFGLVALIAALVGSAVQVIPAYAASIVVNTDMDKYDPTDGKCTLREAIDAANLNAASGLVQGECTAGSPSGVDTITFSGSYIITVGSGGTGLKQLPYIITPITITGRGAGNTIIQAAAAPDTATWRVFQVTSNGNLTLDGVTVRNGRCNGSCTVEGNIDPNAGGGVYNSGTLTVTNSTFSGNFSSGFQTGGGGIYSNGTVTVTNSTFSGNNGGEERGGAIKNEGGTVTATNSTFAGNIGGGIYNSGSLTVTNSIFSGNTTFDNQGSGIYNSYSGTTIVANTTLSGNEGYEGGGIENYGTLSLTNSTLSGNIAYGYGGGIFNDGGTLSVTNSTIAGNEGYLGGGIVNWYVATTILRNTIVANNGGGNCYGTITNGGYNLDSGTTCGFGSNLGSMSNTNPKLGPLADNGGATQTMKLLAGSPAIDQGYGNFCYASPVNGRDQRGVIRPLGAGCDIGAFETSTGAGPDTAGVFRPNNGFLFLKHANVTGFADLALNYGLGGDYPVVGDWDGNGTDTIGVYRNGTFFLRNSNTIGFADIIVSFGQQGDQPVAGDWNRNGVDTIGLYRPSSGQFFLRNTNSIGAPDITFFLGNPGDVGIAGDWDGDGDDTTGVFRPSNGFIFLKNTNDTGFADVALNYGLGGDKPVTGDWNFDGIDTIGVLRGNIFLLRNSNTIGFADMSFALGNPGDHPIAGNWDGQP